MKELVLYEGYYRGKLFAIGRNERSLKVYFEFHRYLKPHEYVVLEKRFRSEESMRIYQVEHDEYIIGRDIANHCLPNREIRWIEEDSKCLDMIRDNLIMGLIAFSRMFEVDPTLFKAEANICDKAYKVFSLMGKDEKKQEQLHYLYVICHPYMYLDMEGFCMATKAQEESEYNRMQFQNIMWNDD